jgi:hypothetical protein
VVGQDGREFRDEVGTAEELSRAEEPADLVDLRGGFTESGVLEDMDAGSEGEGDGSGSGGEVKREERLPVADQEPGRIVVRRGETLEEVLDGLGRRPVGGQGQGELASGPLGRVDTVGKGTVCEPGDQSELVDGQPGSAGQFIAAPEDPGVGLPENGHRGGRAVEPFVPVGGDDQRGLGIEAEGHDQETHGGPGYR